MKATFSPYRTAKPSPLATVAGQLGAEGEVRAGYDAQYNAYRIAGVLQGWDDFRGPNTGVPTLIPQAGGGATYDETNQLVTVTSSTLSTALAGCFNLGSPALIPWWFVYIGSMSYTGGGINVAGISNNGAASTLGVVINSSGSVFSAQDDNLPTNNANSLVVQSVTRRCVISEFIPSSGAGAKNITVAAQTLATFGQAGPYSAAAGALFVGSSLSPFVMSIRTILCGTGLLTPTLRGFIHAYATTTDGSHSNGSTDA
jgi:hypothetical protein